jgi:hypothetical protein
MYWIPLLVIVFLAVIAVAWTPLFALIIAVPAFIAFLIYVAMQRNSDERVSPPTGSAEKYEDETPTGPWGERRS